MNFTAQVQKIVKHYQEARQPWPATSREIAGWAIANKLMQPHSDGLLKSMRQSDSRRYA
jgi:hypothetical protein